MSHFAVSRQVAGHTRTPEEDAALTLKAHRNGSDCTHCGYEATGNAAIFLDGNPLNTERSNLGVACPACIAVRELDTVGADAGVIAWLPALRPEDLSHLQRAIAHALQSPDEDDQQDAESVLGWLASHDRPVTQTWGTHHPQAFGAALAQLTDEQQDQVQKQFCHLSLVLHPARAVSTYATAGIEALPQWWTPFYLDYCKRS